MVTDQQVRRLMKLIQAERTWSSAASKAGMDVVNSPSDPTGERELGDALLLYHREERPSSR